MSCNADIEAKRLLTSITGGDTYELPDVDFSDDQWKLPDGLVAAMATVPAAITIDSLTTKQVDGEGAFDHIMSSVRAHLASEHELGRITGAEYTKTYIALTEAAMSTALQFVLQRDTNYWTGIRAQMEAFTAKINVETSKAQYLAGRATYALTAMKVATEDVAYCLAKEQHEAARAQTMDTRSDNLTPIKGAMGKQKDLYAQQILSYQRSSEINAAKIFSDAWIAHKSIDEGIATPPAFNTTAISEVLSSVKTKNGL